MNPYAQAFTGGGQFKIRSLKFQPLITSLQNDWQIIKMLTNQTLGLEMSVSRIVMLVPWGEI